MGKTNINAKIFNEKTITIDMFGNAFFRKFKYKMVTHARVFSVKTKFEITEKQGLFLANAFHFLTKLFGYDNMCSWERIKKLKIKLPIKNKEIDFDFMEYFIAELEKEKINELKAYLKTSGLKDYNLTDKERKVLDKFDSMKWEEFKLGNLFQRIKTNKLPYKASELSKEATDTYRVPCLTSSFQNQGLNYFVPKDNITILKNVISLPSNSDVYRAYFQSNEFTVLSDAYAIEWIYDDINLSPNQYLFTVPCINKVTDLSIYSYKNKLGGWNVVKDKDIKLPVKDNQIDYRTMETLVNAIKKLIIKDVVRYTDSKLKK